MERIKVIYENNNYPKLERLYKLVKQQHPEIDKKQCKEFLDKQFESQLTSQKNRNPLDMGYIASLTPHQLYQIDIADVQKYSYGYQHNSKEKEEKRIIKLHRNNGYKYIFIMICVFSRKAFVVPMKDKTIESTTSALRSIITDNDIVPNSISSDHDSAFTGKDFQDLLNRYHINHQMNIKNDHYAMGVVDRFIRTLKERITTTMIKNRSSNWIDYIGGIIKQYNESPHSALDGLSPDEVESSDENIDMIQEINVAKTTINQKINKKNRTKFNVGDTVRIRKTGKFNKGTEAQFSAKKYKITQINSKRITLDNNKTYIDHNLLKVVDNGEQDVDVIDEVNREGRVRREVRRIAAAVPAVAPEPIVARRPRRVENYARLTRAD
jgi:hypothetical protein